MNIIELYNYFKKYTNYKVIDYNCVNDALLFKFISPLELINILELLKELKFKAIGIEYCNYELVLIIKPFEGLSF